MQVITATVSTPFRVKRSNQCHTIGAKATSFPGSVKKIARFVCLRCFSMLLVASMVRGRLPASLTPPFDFQRHLVILRVKSGFDKRDVVDVIELKRKELELCIRIGFFRWWLLH